MTHIESRVPAADYFALPSTNISRLKELRRSPMHYRHALDHPKKTEPMALGTAAHCATLEPERFRQQFAVWDRMTEAGAMAPRRGQYWDAFCASHAGRTVITPQQGAFANAIAAAVRADPIAARYLETGEPEVVMTWQMHDRECKGRVDWLTTIDGVPYIVGLKTARDCRHYQFGAAAAKLGYALQWAWYFDGYQTIREKQPTMVEIVVESAAPHAVAVYQIPDDILVYGREEYTQLLTRLAECEATDTWPGPQPELQFLTLPSWVYQAEDDISDLGLEGLTNE